MAEGQDGDVACLPGNISVHHGRSGPVARGIGDPITDLYADGRAFSVIQSQANRLGGTCPTLNSFK